MPEAEPEAAADEAGPIGIESASVWVYVPSRPRRMLGADADNLWPRFERDVIPAIEAGLNAVMLDVRETGPAVDLLKSKSAAAR